MAFYNDEISTIYKTLNSSENGISCSSITQRQEKYGKNILEKEKRLSFFKKLLLQFKNIMIIILFLSALLSCFFAIKNNDHESLFEGILIFVIVLVNALVGVIQEQKAENALLSLSKITEPFASVIREGIVQKIKVHELVVGDIILIKAGNQIPADIRLIESKNLKCNESSMTGESNSISKNEKVIYKKNLPISEQSNICFSGTSVTSGSAKGIIVAVGKNSEIGKIAKILSSSTKEKTPLEKEIDKIGRILTISILLIVFIVFFVQILFSNSLNFMDSLLTAVALAVAAIPESLPAVITIIMALGVQRLAKKHAIIKKLSAVETLGCCNIICSDKTGTLTKNQMKIYHLNLNFKTETVDKINIKSHQNFINIASLCNNVIIAENKFSGDATETAIANFLSSQNIDFFKLKQIYTRICESEFDSTKKQMRVIYKINNVQTLLAKGALDYLLNSCSKILVNNKELILTDKLKAKILKQNEELCNQGERVIAFAYKNNCTNINENDLIFVGFVGIIDPPRKETFSSIKKCKKAGLKTLMITGDHQLTAFAIAKQLGITQHKNEVLTGNDIDNLSDKELTKIISNYSVFARVTPQHKLRIVNALKLNKNIVSMTGDGINDAPSIKSANIGVCMGITGTDVTKEVADIIITDDNFSTIVVAIEEGRTIYQNITKTIIFLLSTNLVEVLGIFVISLIMRDSVFLYPTQILFINLVTDSLPAFALGIESPDKNIMETLPRNANQSLLAGKTGSLILFEGFVQACVVLIMFVFAKNNYGNDIACTMSFLTICLMQIIHAINCKTEKSIFKINIFNNKFFNLSFLFLLALIISVYCIPSAAALFNLTRLTFKQWLSIIITSISIIPLVEIGKKIIK